MLKTVISLMIGSYMMLCFTFDNVSDVLVSTYECSINGTFNAQLLLQRLRVTIHVGVGLSNFVKEYMVILRGANNKM